RAKVWQMAVDFCKNHKNLTPLHFSTTACEKSHKRSLKCWIGKDWSLPRRARPRNPPRALL
ncbi:MAG: hypothetical protein FWE04_05280, partial [Oscillospiraceae bacterium]|nr:hypothetical protein [Oscillospiraceae bacterium]